MPDDSCVVCDSPLHPGLQPWHHLCGKCGYEKSTLQPMINVTAYQNEVDEAGRERALKELRENNFALLRTELANLKPQGGRLLEVGSAHGWFLETVGLDFDAFGIEPDAALAKDSQDQGLKVRQGYFPVDLNLNESFDVIVFNDVFEHMPDITGTINACRQHLTPDGVLLINCPDSRGIFYRLAKGLCHIGQSDFFARLWQKDLPSPHLHYFSTYNLNTLLLRHGFKTAASGSLPTLTLQGLRERIGYAGNYNQMTRAALYLGIASLLPVLKLLPNDISYAIFIKDK